MVCRGRESLCRDEICQVIRAAGSSCTHWLEADSSSTCPSHSPSRILWYSLSVQWVFPSTRSLMIPPAGGRRPEKPRFGFVFVSSNYSFGYLSPLIIHFTWMSLSVLISEDSSFPSAPCDLRTCVREKTISSFDLSSVSSFLLATVRPHELFLGSNICWSKTSWI